MVFIFLVFTVFWRSDRRQMWAFRAFPQDHMDRKASGATGFGTITWFSIMRLPQQWWWSDHETYTWNRFCDKTRQVIHGVHISYDILSHSNIHLNDIAAKPPTQFAIDVQVTYTKLMALKLYQNLAYIQLHVVIVIHMITAVLKRYTQIILQCCTERCHIALIVFF